MARWHHRINNRFNLDRTSTNAKFRNITTGNKVVLDTWSGLLHELLHDFDWLNARGALGMLTLLSGGGGPRTFLTCTNTMTDRWNPTVSM